MMEELKIRLTVKFLCLIGQIEKTCGGGNSEAWEKVSGSVLARLILRWLLGIQRK